MLVLEVIIPPLAASKLARSAMCPAGLELLPQVVQQHVKAP